MWSFVGAHGSVTFLDPPADGPLGVPGLGEMVGHELPGGTYELEDYKDWLTRDVVGAAPAVDGVALPMFCYYAAIAGMGVSIDGLFQLVDATADSGVMFGEAEIDIRKPFRLGETYSVEGRITEIKLHFNQERIFFLVCPQTRSCSRGGMTDGRCR